MIQKRLEQQKSIYDRCYVNWTKKKVIIFKDKSKAEVERIISTDEWLKLTACLSLLFFKWN